MIKANGTLNDAKEKIKTYFNKGVQVTVNLGRNKVLSFEGTLIGVYPALFTVKPDDKGFIGKTSYSYSEYMCGKVLINEKLNSN